jgi:hypothetical protein
VVSCAERDASRSWRTRLANDRQCSIQADRNPQRLYAKHRRQSAMIKSGLHGDMQGAVRPSNASR